MESGHLLSRLSRASRPSSSSSSSSSFHSSTNRRLLLLLPLAAATLCYFAHAVAKPGRPVGAAAHAAAAVGVTTGRQLQAKPKASNGPADASISWANRSVTTQALAYMTRHLSGVTCTNQRSSKRSCLSKNVCLVFGATPAADGKGAAPQKPPLFVVRLGGASAAGADDPDKLLRDYGKGLLRSVFEPVTVFGAAEQKRLDKAQKQQKPATTAQELVASNLWQGRVEYAAAPSDDSSSTTLTHSSVLHGQGAGRGVGQVHIEDAVTAITKPCGHQYSLGHALGNCALPLYLMMSDHLRGEELPSHLRLLFPADSWKHQVLHTTLHATLSHNVGLLPVWLRDKQAAGFSGVCFRNLLLGDGGYVDTTLQSLGGHAQAPYFATRPTFYSSHNWDSFRAHAFKVSGILPHHGFPQRPLIILNDKRYYVKNKLRDDKRSIIDVEALAHVIRAEYPAADVITLRFRDFPLPDQMRFMAAATVFITTVGSSSHMCVFMPRGSTVIALGSPEDDGAKKRPSEVRFSAFDELDRWFPLTYVQFARYATDINDNSSYVLRKLPGVWAGPGDPAERRRWQLYNADIRVDMNRLQPMLRRALGMAPDGGKGAASG